MYPHNCTISSNISVVSKDVTKHYHQNQELTSCDNGYKRRGRPVSNAARERSRVKTLRSAFLDLQETLPSVPPDTKLSKLDVLILATTYITHLMKTLDSCNCCGSVTSSIPTFHPVKKWPMRTRLYDGIMESTKPVNGSKRRKPSLAYKQAKYPIVGNMSSLVESFSDEEIYVDVP